MRRVLLLSCCMLLLVQAFPACAHEGSRSTGEDPGSEPSAALPDAADIVVTARKRPEAEIDVPETLRVLPAQDLRGAGVDALGALGRRLTNVILNRRQDNEPNVVIRGIGSFGNVQGVGFYIDDVQNFTDQSATPGDVERIEVLKGPQGTLYGGSNIGGAIKYQLRQPSDRFGVEARADYGSYASSTLFAALDVPLAAGVTTRLAAYRDHGDGYVRNTLIGGTADRSTETGIRAALAWSVGPAVDVRLGYRHTDLRNGGNIYERASAPDDYRRTVDYNTRPFNHRIVDAGTAQVTASGDRLKLISITSYTTRSNRFRWDIDYGAADVLALTNGDRHRSEAVTQELRLQSTAGHAWNWTIGGYYASITNRNLTIDTDVELGVAAGGPFVIRDYSNGATAERNIAGFGTIDYANGPFALTAGLRLDHVDFVGRVLSPPVVRTDVDRTSLLPMLSLSYQASDTARLYLTAARGVEPGRVNVTSGTGSAFRAETADSLELGVKGYAADRAVTYQLAAFAIDSRRRQLETLFLSAGVLTEETINVGRAISFGAEASLSARPLARLLVSASAGYLDAHWRDRGAVVDLQSVDGRRLPFAPTVSATGEVAYTVPLNRNLDLRFDANAAYNGGFYWNAANTARQSPYAVVDLGITIAEPKTGLEIHLAARNVNNAHYHTEYVSDIFGPGQSLGTTASPSAVSLGARLAL